MAGCRVGRATPAPTEEDWRIMPYAGPDSSPAAAAPGPQGGRLVFYEVCISLVFLTLRRPSRLYRLRPGEWGLWRGLPYTLVSVLLGWWGLPWGLIYTPLVLWTNCSGGRTLTPEELSGWGRGERGRVR
jgi:hypothetical protein